MQRFPLPPNETERLAALARYCVLDTPAEPAFDRLVRLARALFDVPIALISLVDSDRQWFKARSGLDAEQTPRAVSFCGHAVAADELLVVPDAAADPRFSDNPLVTGGPFIRFYAGAPLRTRDGFALGTLCVIDRQPRAGLDPEQRQLLEDLAAIAVDELELRQLLAQTAHRALHDNLTGLPNRSLFENRLHHQLFQAQRDDRMLAVFLFDLDNFKDINDSQGHAAGDRLLVGMARRLEHAFRVADTIARWGGDEFTALVALDSEAELRGLIRRLGVALAEPSAIAPPVLCSIGVALYPAHGDSVAALLEAADEALYRAKQGGRHRCVVAGSGRLIELAAE